MVYQWVAPTKDTIFVAEPGSAEGEILLVEPIPGYNDFHPDWSPDGASIVFVVDHGRKTLWTMGADGSDPAMLFEGHEGMPWVEHPAWSPDGREIVAEATDWEPSVNIAQRASLVVIDVETGVGEEIAVLEGTNTAFSGPRWSPDGNAIVCSIGRFNEDGTAFTGEALAVLQRTGDTWSEPELITEFEEFAGYPDWGPDGRIVYGTSDVSLFFFTVANSNGRIESLAPDARDLLTVLPDGSDRQPVTEGSDVAGKAIQPTWTPDGRIVFTVWPSEEGERPLAALIDADGSNLEVLDLLATHVRVVPDP